MLHKDLKIIKSNDKIEIKRRGFGKWREWKKEEW